MTTATPSTSQAVFPSDVEPFGQAGVRRHLAPIFARVVLICAVISMVMYVRSWVYADELRFETARANWVVRSVVGRIFVQRFDRNPDQNPVMRSWSFMSYDAPERSMDGWRPGIFKTIGLQWGVDRMPRRWGGERYAWLRVKWSTLAVIYALPAAIIVVRHRRQRRFDRSMA